LRKRTAAVGVRRTPAAAPAAERDERVFFVCVCVYAYVVSGGVA
jgi:hypothetical protein